jgi:hypothetical protein
MITTNRDTTIIPVDIVALRKNSAVHTKDAMYAALRPTTIALQWGVDAPDFAYAT